MATVFGVAEYILEQVGFVSTMKLQKLMYYSQAYSLVHYGKPLFGEDFEAWANGPVCPDLFRIHRGKFVVGPGELSYPESPRTTEVSVEARGAIDHVLKTLGSYSGRKLSGLTHCEKPWLEARAGVKEGERCNTVITKEAIRRYYAAAQCKNPAFA